MTTPIQIKTFRCKTLQEALSRIRNELGPNAAILETKEVPGSLLRFQRARFEITASSNQVLEEDAASERSVADATSNRFSVDHNSLEATESIENKPLMETTDERKSHHPSDESTKDQALDHLFPQAFLDVYHELVAHEVESEIAKEWVSAARDFHRGEDADPMLIRNTIARWIRDALDIDQPAKEWGTTIRRLAVIGASGVGKTSAIAKLAALASEEMQLSVGVLSLDHSHRNANGPLPAFCEIMHWPFLSASTELEYRKTLDKLAYCDLVLIDTPSCIVHDLATAEFLRVLICDDESMQRHWIVDASKSDRSFRRALRWYDVLRPTHLLVSKLDESHGITGLYPSLVDCHLPLGFLSGGPRIPSDIVQANGISIANSFFHAT